MTPQRVQHLFGMLGSDSPGEAENALRALQKTLRQHDLKFHHLRIVSETEMSAIEKPGAGASALRRENLELRDEVDQLMTELGGVLIERDELEIQRDKLKNDLADLRNTLDMVNDALHRADRDLKSYRKQLHQKNSQNEQLQRVNEQLQQRLDRVRLAILDEPVEPQPQSPEPKSTQRASKGTAPMQVDEFEFHAQRIVGNGYAWQTRLAQFLNISRRRVYHYRAGNTPIPPDVVQKLRSSPRCSVNAAPPGRRPPRREDQR